MKVESYYDLGCCKCGFYWSTDFFRGMYTDKKLLIADAKKAGWKEDKDTKRPICPNCAKKVN